MNNDEPFEHHLRRQPLRPIPPAWRGEILTAATARQPTNAAPRRDEESSVLVAGWRLRFARMPVAWAALAALWIVMIGVNLTMPGPIVSVALETPASAQLSVLAALDSQSAEFDGASDSSRPVPKTSPAAPPSDLPLRPRSERRSDTDLGEKNLDFSVHLVA